MNTTTPADLIGIHHNMPEAVYRGMKDRISPSGEKHQARSPLHLRAYLDNPPAETPVQRLGRLGHKFVLEPERVSADVAVAPDASKRSIAGKEIHAAFEAEAAAAGKIIVSASEYAIGGAIGVAVRDHPLVPALLAGAHIESSLFWTDPETGAACKGRPDALRLYSDGGAAVLDLKTTIDASPGAFARAVLNYGYHVQAAAYLEGLRVLGYEARDFIVIAVEKSPPYCCAIYRMPDELLLLGERRWHRACEIFARCIERNEWPGYSPDLQPLPVPPWAISELFQPEIIEE